MVDYANEYFVNIANNLTGGQMNHEPYVHITIPNPDSFGFLPTSIPEVTSVIKSLKNSSNGLQDISVRTLKNNSHIFSVHVMFLYNHSVEKVTYPKLLKIARVVPGHKAGQRDIIDNYRPFSNLPVLSKVFETLTLRRFTSFANRCSLLSDCQFGFQRGRNITQAAIKLTSHVTNAYHYKSYAACFFLDLKKAFDTIDHILLLEKLYHAGFRGPSHQYVNSYLSNRKQYVQVGQHKSSDKEITKGVPQGSILGPFLFCLYINDIVEAVEADAVLFADDAAFFVSAATLPLLYVKLRKLFVNLSAYLKTNRLIPNLKKSKLMYFSSRPCEFLEEMKFDNEIIEWVEEYQYLGLIMSNKMCFSSHIQRVTSRISRFSGVFFALNRVLPRSILILLYFAFIVPHLTLHIEIWGAAPECHIKKLAVRQNKLLRAILGIGFENGIPTLGTEEMYRSSRVLNLKNLFKLKLFKLLVSLLNGKLPLFYDILLRPLLSSHGYNTRAGDFRHPLIVCEVERRAIAHQLVVLYEETPPELYDLSLKKAITHYKGHLLNSQ